MSSWPFLVRYACSSVVFFEYFNGASNSNFRHIATDIQQRAERTYDRDLSQRRKAEAAGSLAAPRAAPVYSSDPYLRRRTGQSLRTLVDIMGTQDFFAQLHACLSWVLKASGSRLYEKQLSGPPLVISVFFFKK